MDAFKLVIRTLDALRQRTVEMHHSVREITSAPALSVKEWCIEGASIIDLSAIPPSGHITSLYLIECRKLTSFSGIAECLPNLETLWVYESDKVASLDGLQFLKTLRELTIWPSFNGFIEITTLKPLAAATALQTLILAGKTKDGSLNPLHDLEHLRQMFISNSFKWDEFARFEATQPKVDFPWKGSVVHKANKSVLNCASCGTALSMMTGKELKLCCPTCDQDRLTNHLKRYSELSRK